MLSYWQIFRQLVHWLFVDNILVQFNSWWKETMLKDENVSKWFEGNSVKNFLSHSVSLNIKSWLLKKCPILFVKAALLQYTKVAIEFKVQNSAFWKISNVLACHILVALNNNFKTKSTMKFGRKYNLWGVLTELKINCVLLDNPLENVWDFEQKRTFWGKYDSWLFKAL